MIILHHDGPYDTNIGIHYLLPIMAKIDLMKAAEKLGVYIPKSYNKDRMGGALADFILSNPREVLAVLNGKELTLMKELIAAGANTCIARPMQKRFNKLQNLGLVVTLDNLPVYRTLRVLDTTSLHELYCVITFLFDWCYLKKHAFCFQRNGEIFRLSNLTRLSDIQMRPGEKMGFIYDYGDKNWEHTIELLSADSYAGDSSHYVPACLEASYGDPGEEAGGNREVKENWSEYEKKEAPSLALLNDTIQFFWENKG